MTQWAELISAHRWGEFEISVLSAKKQACWTENAKLRIRNSHKVHNLKSETEIIGFGSQGMALSIEFSHFDSCNTWHFTCDTCLNKELSELEKKWTIRHAQRGKLARAALCTMQEEQCEQEYLLKVFTHFTVKHQTKIHRPSSMAPGFYPLHWNTWF